MSILDVINIIIFGIVEGITEWLPISSTGHMLLLDEVLHLSLSDAFKTMFFVVIQLGAILAVVVLYWKRLFPFSFSSGVKIKQKTMSLWYKVVVACVPSAVVGLFLDDFLEAHLGTPTVIAIMLILYGVFFILIERKNRGDRVRCAKVADIGYGTAFAIGLFQVLALIPGTSRSGATIVGALLIGVSRVAAAEFTFFLAVPTMLGASLLKMVKFGFSFTSAELAALLLGMAVAFVVSMLAIRFLMGYIKKHDFQVFGWYRIVLGIVVLLWIVL